MLSVNSNAFPQEGTAGGRKMVSGALNMLVSKAIKMAAK